MSNVYEPMIGENITEAADNMVALAKESGATVTASFNDIALTADPGDDPDGIVRYYGAESERRAEEYRNSPQYVADQKAARLRQEARDAALAFALGESPEFMTLRDPDGWQKSVDANPDSYGRGVIEYAERWARIMEGRMSAGASLADIAKEASHIADNEGITGFMYGAAVSILAHVWVHGEELRRWHNLDAQIGNEGEEANEGGGTLNPALLNIGKPE